MEGEDREDNLGADFSLLLPGTRSKSQTFACSQGSLQALGNQYQPRSLTVEGSSSVAHTLRPLHPVPGQQQGSTAGAEGMARCSLMVCSSHSEALLASSQVLWTRWKNTSDYSFSICKGKHPHPHPPPFPPQRFGKLKTPSCRSLSKGGTPTCPGSSSSAVSPVGPALLWAPLI